MNTQIKNYFQGTDENPYHISVGGIVKNNEGKICCHYFDTITHKSVGTIKNLTILMRETLEPNETLENCLARGLMEEFGITANIKSYIGVIPSVRFESKSTGVVIEKTTLYFLCDLVSMDESKRKKGDLEAQSEIRWIDPKELYEIMKEQSSRFNGEDGKEYIVVERVLN